MKIPRWLMFSLWTSIVQAVLGAAGWWWVKWPDGPLANFGASWQPGSGKKQIELRKTP